MFGGLAFLLKGNMCCGIVRDRLMVRVLPEKYEALLGEPHAGVMDFTGRPMKAFLFVKPEGYESDGGLNFWLDRAVEHSDSQPAKRKGCKVKHKVVSREEWLEDRKALLAEEKEFTRLRDAMTRKVRELPWVTLEKKYWFEGPKGKESLEDLFGGRSQLIVYHFMMGPDWEEGCKSCSFWADNFDGIPIHLAHRDVSFAAVSRAPFDAIERFRKRMGWSFYWVSSLGSDFNFDFGVSFSPGDIEAGKAIYNYRPTSDIEEEMPGVSVFYKDTGAVYHTYSAYSRGIDFLNGAYNYLDLVPKGRDEDELEYTMSWLRHHDRYES
jgi:predicted dithiol-disulfide oxidoreductase (DUF899 family)